MIKYSDDLKQNAIDVAEVFKNSGIRRPYDDLRIQRMIEHADILISAWKNGKMIGVARAITDFSYCCYLSDLAVNQNYQKLDIGKELVNQLQMKVGRLEWVQGKQLICYWN